MFTTGLGLLLQPGYDYNAIPDETPTDLHDRGEFLLLTKPADRRDGSAHEVGHLLNCQEAGRDESVATDMGSSFVGGCEWVTARASVGKDASVP